MANQSKQSDVEQMFNRIARRYDLANDLQSLFLHRYWKKKVKSLAAVSSNQFALDICCGTGDIAFELAQTGATVVGIDLSQPMLEIAQFRIQKYNFPINRRLINSDYQSKQCKRTGNVFFIKSNALNLPFKNNTFDTITIGYGLRNICNYNKALAEMFRALKPGGRIVILEFGKPPNKLWNKIYFFHLKKIVPFLGKLIAKDWDAYFYIYESLLKYPGQFVVDKTLKDLGGINTKIINIMAGAMTINYCEKPFKNQ